MLAGSKEALAQIGFGDDVAGAIEQALSVTNLSASGLFKNANIEIRKGEIVGLFGLAGAGRTELLRAIYGADQRESGSVEVFGKTTIETTPCRSIARGQGLVPEDRKSQG